MPRVNLIDRKTKLGVKALRVAMGGKGHRPSAKNVCLGKKMHEQKGQFIGTGGMRSEKVHKAFVQAAMDCGFDVKKSLADVH